MAVRKDNTPDLNDRSGNIPRQDDLSSDRNRLNDEDDLDTRNVSSDQEEGDDDIDEDDDDELDEDDFEDDDEDVDEDSDEDR